MAMLKSLLAFSAVLVTFLLPTARHVNGQMQILQTLSLFNLNSPSIANILTNRSPLDQTNLSYDYIIIGAGSGGSVLANRLSANPNTTVLLLEAGPEETFLTDIPLLAPFQAATPFNWGYKNEPQAGACLSLKEKRCNAARGKALGGTSVINFLIYTRGNRADYDSWSALGNPGWSYNEVLPYFRKSEDCTACTHIDVDYHGFQGPLQVEHPRIKSPLLKRFLKAGVDLGYKVTDPNGRQHVGFSEAQATMHRGRRCSAAKAFLGPEVRSRPNLQIALRSRATKILLEGGPGAKRAYGVEVIANRQKAIVRARREVLLTAGAFNSPQLLMLSGIGPREHLRKVGIETQRDLQVGHNLQDHLSLSHLLFLVNESITVSDTLVQNPRHVLNYLLNGEGPYSIPGGALGLAFVQTKFADKLPEDYPDIELVLGAGGLNGDTIGTLRHLLRLPDDIFETVYAPVSHVPGFSIAPVMLRPKSRGRVMLRDSNPLHWPLIHGNYFRDEGDLEVLLEGVKAAIRVIETPAFRTCKARLHDIPLPACARQVFNSDDYWRCVLRNVATSLGHPVGTCKMGPDSDADAVVDARLRVKGVRNLRVVDASIMPHIVAGHTNSVVMMIGEKAADMIIEDWT